MRAQPHAVRCSRESERTALCVARSSAVESATVAAHAAEPREPQRGMRNGWEVHARPSAVRRHCAFSAAAERTELERVGSDHAKQLAAAESELDLAPLPRPSITRMQPFHAPRCSLTLALVAAGQQTTLVRTERRLGSSLAFSLRYPARYEPTRSRRCGGSSSRVRFNANSAAARTCEQQEMISRPQPVATVSDRTAQGRQRPQHKTAQSDRAKLQRRAAQGQGGGTADCADRRAATVSAKVRRWLALTNMSTCNR